MSIEPLPKTIPSLEWETFPGEDASDAIIAAMVEAGIEVLFFTSGAELVFYQEAIARARAAGRRAPRLITITHEHINLNAAIGYAAVSGKPAATAVHVDAGTLNQGGAIHTAWHSGVPILMTAGGAPASYPGTLPGGRDGGGHIWLQQTFDQNGIVRQYTKWDHRLDWQDNPGLVVGRAVQMAVTEPKGPVYLSIPKELALRPLPESRFPTLQQLGVAEPAAPSAAGILTLAERLVAAENPVLIVSGSGRNPSTVPALVKLCEFLGLPVVNSTPKTFLCFPMTHPLRQRAADVRGADVVFALEATVPWMPGPDEPPATAYIATCDLDPSRSRIPTYEFWSPSASDRRCADHDRNARHGRSRARIARRSHALHRTRRALGEPFATAPRSCGTRRTLACRKITGRSGMVDVSDRAGDRR